MFSKKIGFISALIVTLLGIPTVGNCNTFPAVTAYIVGTGTYDDGSIFIFFDRQISSCNSSGRLDIPASNPSIKNVLAIAMTAYSSRSAVRIHPGSCAGTVPVFSTTGDSYIYLTKDSPS